MIKGTRIEATNSTRDVATGATNYALLSCPTGKTFVLTDLVVSATYAGETELGVASNYPLRLYDFVGSGSTDASTTATKRLSINLPADQSSFGQAAAATFVRRGVALNFTNGPEFSSGVTPSMGNGGATGASSGGAAYIGTGCVWIAGIIR